MELNLLIAFAAGFISFLSPCIFPIIPSYIGYIGAATYSDGYKKNRGAIPLILSFIIGFTIVFSLMGVAFSTLGFAFKNYSVIITRASGILVIILGLNTIFSFLKFLDYDKRVDFRSNKKGVFSSLLLGMAFGAGWSPCIGPILASILFLAGNSTTLLGGLILLLFFSLGLGVPFLLSGLFISSFREKSAGIKKNLNKIRIFSGVFIMFIGIFIFLNKLSNINIVLFQLADNFSKWYITYFRIFNTILGSFNIVISLLIVKNVFLRRKNGDRFVTRSIISGCLFILGVITILNVINWGHIVEAYLTFQGI